MGPIPEDGEQDDDDLVIEDVGLAEPVGEGSELEEAVATTRPVRGARTERRRAARARRGAGARNRAAVFSQNLPAELKKLGVMVAGTVVILGILTVVLR